MFQGNVVLTHKRSDSPWSVEEIVHSHSQAHKRITDLLQVN